MRNEVSSPLEIERTFQKLIEVLPSILSKRSKFEAISTFLVQTGDSDTTIDSYLEQLISFLPEFSHPYEYTGLHPAWFEEKLDLLTQHFRRTEFQNYHQIQYSFDSLKQAHQEVQNWIGNYSAENRNPTLFTNPKIIQRRVHTVLAPVIEQVTGEDKYSGRLRNLEVNVVGKSNSGKHDLIPVYSVIGEEKQSGEIIKTPEYAVNKLLMEYGITSGKYWKATVGFEQKLGWHSGRSANLAMAGLFFCSVLESMELREQFRLNPAVVITGDISKNGEVLPVSKETLKPKLEAAFFSWAQVMVVPQAQVGEVFKHLEELKEKYSKRKLLVIPVNKISDLFYNRRLTLHSKKGRIEHVIQQIWKRRFSVAAILTVTSLLALIGFLLIGPIDRNPTYYEYSESAIILKNEYGRALSRIEVDEFNIRNGTLGFPAVKHTIVELFDHDGDGENEILLGLQSNNKSQIGTFTLLDSNAKDTLWHKRLDFDVPYEKHPYAYYKNYRPIIFEVVDIEGDGDFEIIANLQQYHYFKGMVAIFDASTGEIEQQLNMPGWVSMILTNDYDDDGILDLLFCVLYKGWNKSGCMVLGLDDINGFAPLHERYLDQHKRLAPIKLAFQVPYTIVGKAIREMDTASISNEVSIPIGNSAEGRDLIVFTILDTVFPRSMNRAHIGLIYDFDHHFNLISIGSSDTYDQVAQELYQEGKTPFLADAQYLHTFRDSLLWFDGNNWVNQPTLNKYFLEKIGEDSSYYKEWYFRK